MAKFRHNSGHAVSLTQFLFNLLSTLIHSRSCFLWCPFVSCHFLSIFLIHDFSVWYIWPLSIFSISPLSLFCSNFLSSFYIFCSCPPSSSGLFLLRSNKQSLSNQCDQIGQLLKVPNNKLSYKSSPNILNLYGLFWQRQFVSKNCSGKFLNNFWGKWTFFVFWHPITPLRNLVWRFS